MSYNPILFTWNILNQAKIKSMASSSSSSASAKFENKMKDDWKLPKVKKNQIYKESKFNFLRKTSHNYTIQTETGEIQISEPSENIKLFSPQTINHLKSKNYKFINFGLVQVGIKAAVADTGKDLNNNSNSSSNSILCVLRDARWIDFQDSLLGGVETNLENGPIFFNCHPGFTLSLDDKHILDGLVLQMENKNQCGILGSVTVHVMYKIYYKAMVSAFAPSKEIVYYRNGERLIVLTDLSKSNPVLPKWFGKELNVGNGGRGGGGGGRSDHAAAYVKEKWE